MESLKAQKDRAYQAMMQTMYGIEPPTPPVSTPPIKRVLIHQGEMWIL